MARTFVQQSQISGSLSFNDTLEAGSGLAYKQTVAEDLDALRSQINKIIGGDRWYDALSGSQDLADIYAAMQVSGADAYFQGNIAATSGSFQGDLAVVGDVAAMHGAFSGNIVANGDIAATSGSFSADLFVGGDAAVSGRLDVTGAIEGTSTLDIAGAVDFGSTLSVTGDAQIVGALTGSFVKLTGNIDSDGDAAFAGGLSSANIVTVGVADIGGDLTVDGVADFAAAVYMASSLGVSGSLAVAGAFVATGDISGSANLKISGDADIDGTLNVDGAGTFNDGLTVSGDRLEVTGSFGLTGAADLDSTLNVDGVADFKSAMFVAGAAGLSGSLAVAGKADFAGIVDVAGTLSASAVKVDGDVAKRLYIVAEDGSLKDEEKLWFDQTKLYVTGSVEVSDDLTVKGGDITMSNSMSISSATDGKLVLTSPLVEASGDLKVAGNDISGSAGLNITLLSAGDVQIAGDLQVMGNEIKSSGGSVVLQLVDDDAIFKSDVTVIGDLRVQGTMTYIETTNLKVQDAFIHLATGSTGTSNSGIVLHGGAGASADLMLAQDGGAGEFVFAKVAHEDHDNIDTDNQVGVNGAELVPAWLNAVKLGGVEGSLSGSLSARIGTGDVQLEAVGDLTLRSNSNSIDLMSGAEYTTFDTNFTATSIVGALNELYAAGAGGSKKGTASLTHLNVGTGVLTFGPAGANIGTLNTSGHQFVDVYLNGVLLAPGADLTGVSTTSVTLEAGIAAAVTAQDVFTVILRGAA